MEKRCLSQLSGNEVCERVLFPDFPSLMASVGTVCPYRRWTSSAQFSGYISLALVPFIAVQVAGSLKSFHRARLVTPLLGKSLCCPYVIRRAIIVKPFAFLRAGAVAVV